MKEFGSHSVTVENLCPLQVQGSPPSSLYGEKGLTEPAKVVHSCNLSTQGAETG